MEMLTYLTGKGYSDWDVVVNEPEEKSIPDEVSYAMVSRDTGKEPKGKNLLLFAGIGAVGMISMFGLSRRKR